MTPPARTLRATLDSFPLLPVLRASSGVHLADTARRLLDSDVPLVELTLNTPNCLDVAASLRDAYPNSLIGVGSVFGPDQARRALAAGADYIVTPVVDDDTAGLIISAGRELVMGAFTPTEVAKALTAGAEMVKVFPAVTGSPAHLAALRDVFPHDAFIPTGGVTAGDAQGYLAAGATAVGIGGSWFREALSGRGLRDIGKRTYALGDRLGSRRGDST